MVGTRVTGESQAVTTAAGSCARHHSQLGRVDDADGLHEVTCLPMKHEHTDGSRHWFTATVPLERTGAFGYTVRVLPHSEHLADPAELGVVTSA